MSNAGDPFTGGEAALWVQRDGPNSPMEFLGCSMFDDITEPLGDVTRYLCPDPKQRNKWVTKGSTQAPPGLVTTSMTGKIMRVLDFLEEVECPYTLYLLQSKCAPRDVFTNFDRAYVLQNSRTTQRVYSSMAQIDANDQSTVKGDISAEPPLLKFVALAGVRQSTTETRALNDVHVCGSDTCASQCGASSKAGDNAMAVGDALAGSAVGTGDVLLTSNGGTIWTATAVDPFGTSEDVITGLCLDIGVNGSNTSRKIVGRGTTDAGNPAEVAISDDDGATWSHVNVGSTNGEYFADGNTLFALDSYHIWAVGSNGHIYFSDDGGENWTTQNNAAITTGAYHGIFFSDAANGMAVAAAGIVAKTIDGGVTWSAATVIAAGAAVLNCVTYSWNFWFVGATNGNLYQSADGGTTWSVNLGNGTGSVKDVAFKSNTSGLFGAMIYNTTAPVGRIYYTINGGTDWLQLSGGTPTNSGLNAVAIASDKLLYAVGETNSGTAVIIKVTPVYS